MVTRMSLPGSRLSAAIAVYASAQNLSQANVGSGASLTGADLSGATLDGASLAGDVLRTATLTGASLVGTDLRGANLSGMTLTGVDLLSATLTGANLSAANLSGVTLSTAILTGADLSNANLGTASLTSADLSDANLAGASLAGTDLSNANLTDAILKGATLDQTMLIGTNLSGADLTGVTMQADTLTDATLLGVVGLSDAALASGLGVAPNQLGLTLDQDNLPLETATSIQQTLAGACGGHAIPGAGTSGPGASFQPMILVGIDPPAGQTWAPPAIRYDMYVACVNAETANIVETCPYVYADGSVAPSLQREQMEREVTVVDPATGAVVLDQWLYGSWPDECPYEKDASQTVLAGSDVTDADILGVLTPLVGTAPTSAST
jgi:uncharacterized protein YjbI with pentapeptide repeats